MGQLRSKNITVYEYIYIYMYMKNVIFEKGKLSISVIGGG